MSAFEKAFDLLIGHEGGYSTDRADRGNWTGGAVGKGEFKGTKYGISAAAYPALDIKNLTIAQARAIYKRDYWDKVRGDDLPPAFALIAFDAAVNAGVRPGSRFLQMALRVGADGVIGPQTIAAARAARDQVGVMVEALAQRAEYNRKVPSADAHGLGWSRRLFKLAFQAIDF